MANRRCVRVWNYMAFRWLFLYFAFGFPFRMALSEMEIRKQKKHNFCENNWQGTAHAPIHILSFVVLFVVHPFQAQFQCLQCKWERWEPPSQKRLLPFWNNAPRRRMAKWLLSGGCYGAIRQRSRTPVARDRFWSSWSLLMQAVTTLEYWSVIWQTHGVRRSGQH